MIDLRSDTVTKPTPAMRKAMYDAEVGDDAWGDDPTTNHLQEVVAEKVGKEAALFVPSGTMGNLIALLVHAGWGNAAILGNHSHSFAHEAGGAAAFGGVQLHAVPTNPDGTLDLPDIEGAILPDDLHHAPTRVICLENTHNLMGGCVLSLAFVRQVREVADRHGLALHLDGARVFNAAVFLGLDIKELVEDVDSVMFCLSKGLSAPVGSMLCGSQEFIERSLKVRRMLGGSMRQVGVLAAAGLVALDQMVDRLAEDHVNARRLAEGLATIPGLEATPEMVETNIVMLNVTHPRLTAPSLLERMAQEDVHGYAPGPKRVRLVTHYQVSREDVETAIQRFGTVMAAA